MPLGVKPKCHLCKISFSVMWRKNDRGEIICNSCSIRPPSSSTKRTTCPFNLRKSTRAKSSRLRHSKTQQQTKGRSRRNVFKKTPPEKSPQILSDIKTSSYIFHKGSYYQIGDIVSVLGTDDNEYFAQIHGLAADERGEKSVFLTWLLPIRRIDEDDYFDPRAFTLGPEEMHAIKIEYISFVCNAPENYFWGTEAPFPVFPEKNVSSSGYIWTTVCPRLLPVPSQAAVFGHEQT